MYRDALGEYHTPFSVNSMFSDDDIIFNNSLMYPYTLIRMNRLLLFVRICGKNPPFISNLLLQVTFSPGSWVACLLQDLEWLAVSENFSACASFSLENWMGYFTSHPKSANAIRRFCASPWANISTHKANINIVGLNHTHCCALCTYGCDSDQQLETHLFKHHGIKNRIRLYVSGTRCPICLCEFWQREVYLNHIKRGRTPCKRQVVMRGPVLSVVQADEIDLSLRSFFQKQHRRGLRRHAVESPCVRAAGPKLPLVKGPVRPVAMDSVHN